MSFPSAKAELAAKGLDITVPHDHPKYPTETQAEDALYAAFQKDVPNGFAVVKRLAAQAREQLVARVQTDPDAPEGREVARLMTDVARRILAARLGVQFHYGVDGALVADQDGSLQLRPKPFEELEARFPLGIEALRAFADVAGTAVVLDDSTVSKKWDPKSQVGLEVARLMADDARPTIERTLETAYGFYNCCDADANKKGKPKKRCAHYQIKLQLTPDC